MNQKTLPNIIITLLLVFLILYLGSYTLNASLATTDTGTRISTTQPLDGTTWKTLDDNVGQNEDVYNSLGYAINLTGSSDSYWQTTTPVTVASDDTWTVSLWAHADQAAATRTMTALSINGRIIISYNGTDGNWTAWYYDDGSTNSYQVNVSAPNQPSTLTQITLVRNTSTLTIYRNTTRGENVTLTGTSSVDAPVGADNWDGRVDEVRTFDDALNSSQRSALHSDPVGPQPFTNRTARVMFDEPDRKYQLLFFANGKVETSNESYSQGLEGERMDGKTTFNDVTGATDYKWDVVGPRIQPVSGGELEYAPVAYVEYDEQSRLDTLVDDWNRAMGLAGVLLVLLPLGVIVVYLMGARSGR